MVWTIFAVATGLAVLSILWPLARAPRERSRTGSEIALYKAQVAEIDRDAAQGLLAEADAEGAKAEAARRFMAIAEEAGAANPAAGDGRRVKLASLAALIFVPAFALGLYAVTGAPELPDQPLSARLQKGPQQGDLLAAIEKVERHLAQNPDDGRAYEVLAPVYLRMGRAYDSARAYNSALRLLGETPERLALYGESLVYAANGVVTPEAQKAFAAAAAQNPALPKPRFFLGLAAEQDGDAARARLIWSALVAGAPADAPWALALRQRLAALPGAPETGSPQPDIAAQQPGPGAQPELAAKIAAMPEAERSGAIRGMVDNLATRLARNGQDVEGWLRLVRAYSVLNESSKARAALLDARRNLAGDPTATARIDALARELGIES